MTRPTIVRADTIDLQDPDSPHAAEHTKHINGNGIAPHQAAEYQHVAQERHSEEQALADAWTMAGNATNPNATADAEENGTQAEAGDAASGEESEGESDEDMMDRISSSPSIDEEEIDFDFVYALHTFTATVEGQANATKGDTMVLLDDSNSYWWLVRVVKDSSIGYLPAEHIETPTERLARLNKHRNIDLAQTMLGDTPEKSRNPLKMAMRRRNGKTVQFAAPTYVEASDYDYSDDEEPAGVTPAANGTKVDDPAVNGQPIEVEERNAPEEANVHATRRYSGDQSSIASKNSFDSTHKQSLDGGIGEDPQLSPKLVDRSEAAPLKSRKGTPRNTDSFLKDDSIETRKITLTPGLLREDANQVSSKNSSMDSQRNPSMESLTKVPSPSDSTSTSSLVKKDGKDKKKDKNKGGMLSGLFKSKKKDKKGGREDDGIGEEKSSLELGRGGSPSGNPSPIDRHSTQPFAAGRDVQSRGVAGRPISAPIALQQPSKPQIKMYPMAELQGSEAAHEMLGTTPDGANPHKTPKAKRSKERVELDDFDSPGEKNGHDPLDDDDEITTSPSGTIMGGLDFVHIPTSFGDDDDEIGEPSVAQSPPHHSPPPAKQSVESQREVEDDKDVFTDARENTTSPVGAPEHATIQPPSKAAPVSAATHEAASASSRSSSLVEAETPKSATPTASNDGKQNWDDGALRAWLDAEEVKDMLTIVHASARLNGTIEPVSDDHPLMRGLYANERNSVERMMGELDSLMLGWAGRKGMTL